MSVLNLIMAAAGNEVVGISNPIGPTFAAVTLPTTSFWSQVMTMNGKNFIIPTISKATIGQYSSDGVNWVDQTIPNDPVSNLSYKTPFVVNSTTLICTRTNTSAGLITTNGGNTWSLTAGLFPTSSSTGIFSGVSDNGTFYLIRVFTASIISYTTNGSTWSTPVSSGVTGLSPLSAWILNNTLFVYNSGGNVNYCSLSSVNPTSMVWTTVAETTPFSSTNYVNPIGMANNLLFCRRQSIANSLYSSSDGLTWTAITLPSAYSTTTWTNISYLNGFYILTSGSSTYLYSADLVSWYSNILPVTLASGQTLNKMTYDPVNNKILITTSQSGGTNLLFYSI